MPKHSAESLLKKLESKGLANRQELSSFIIDKQQEEELPLYLKAVIGVGAYLAAPTFIGFFMAILSFPSEGTLIIWGLVLVAGAIGIQKLAGNENSVKQNFLIQSSFVSMVIGKSFFVYALAEKLGPEWGATLGLIIITSITYNIYKVSIDRFIFPLATLYSIMTSILMNENIRGASEFLLNSFFLLQLIGATILLTNGKVKRIYSPFSYALLFSLCSNVLFLASFSKFGFWGSEKVIHLTFINTILTGWLIFLFGWAAGGMKKLRSEPLVLGAIGAVMLGLISAPGILLSIGLLVLGYARFEKVLSVTGALLMPIFLWEYYHNLDISLLQKSGVLAGSGIVLLAGRFYLKHKGWDKGDSSCVQK